MKFHRHIILAPATGAFTNETIVSKRRSPSARLAYDRKREADAALARVEDSRTQR